MERPAGRFRHHWTNTTKYCSPLGSLLHEIRRCTPKGDPGVGIQTIRTLEEAGIATLRDLRGLSFDDLLGLGVRRRQAKIIRGYLKRRSA